MPDGVLHTWKEISQYAGCGVRTVQRWEALFGLPVHRPKGSLRSSVFAMRHEIDEWFQQRKTRHAAEQLPSEDGNTNGVPEPPPDGHRLKYPVCPTCGGSGHLAPIEKPQPSTPEALTR